jgi:FkbM family methyltransferase
VVIETGRGDAFRHAAWLERTATALRGPLARSPFRAPLKRAYEAVLDRLPGDHLLSHFPGGESVRLAAAYRQVTWNLDEYRAFKADISAGDVVFDIGANLGAYSLLFAQWVGPAGRVFAFEPAPEARRGLERHLRLNHCSDRVTISGEAVSATRGLAQFRAAGLQGDNRLATPGDGGRRMPVRTTSIDEFCSVHYLAPALIKIDVEGAELDALKGARRTIAARGDALHLYVEMHPGLWPSTGCSREQMEEELARQGLIAERLDGGADLWGLEGVCLRLRPCAS